MICHEFKGGIGTASRVVDDALGGWTVGVLVQANYGTRDWLRVDGVPVGEAIPIDGGPEPVRRRSRPPAADRAAAPGSGSIIVVVATDAPLLPHQCERLAQRAGLGIARMGGTGGHTAATCSSRSRPATGCRLAGDDDHPSGLATWTSGWSATVIDAPVRRRHRGHRGAIVNALVAAETMVGRDGITAHAIPHERLVALMRAAGR